MVRVELPFHLRKLADIERVDDRPLRHQRPHVDRDLAIEVSQLPQVKRQFDPDHYFYLTYSVCTSTATTGGRSCTIAFHESPASAEQYTCPPVVPKYTPHASSESTSIASRSTLT